MKQLILVSLLIVAIIAKNGPVFPEQFEQEFTEQTYSPLKSQIKGKFFYDWTNKVYRVDRDNGKGDRYCGSVYKLTDTPCTHFVVEGLQFQNIVKQGKRYLYFPEHNDCCYCCDAAHGCGLLKPDWAIDAVFVQTITAANGEQIEKWNMKGLQDNFYYQTAQGKVLTEIDQTPNDYMYFDPATQHKGIRDSSVFRLPSGCSASKTCSWFSVCTPLRGLRG